MKLTKCYLPPVHQKAVLERSIFHYIQLYKRAILVKVALSRNGIFKKCSISFVLGSSFPLQSCFKYNSWHRSWYSFGCNCCFVSFRKYSLKWGFFNLWLYPGCGFSHKWFVYEVMISINSSWNEGIWLRETKEEDVFSSFTLMLKIFCIIYWKRLRFGVD